jgi:hypothetical protein
MNSFFASFEYQYRFSSFEQSTQRKLTSKDASFEKTLGVKALANP